MLKNTNTLINLITCINIIHLFLAFKVFVHRRDTTIPLYKQSIYKILQNNVNLKLNNDLDFKFL